MLSRMAGFGQTNSDVLCPLLAACRLWRCQGRRRTAHDPYAQCSTMSSYVERNIIEVMCTVPLCGEHWQQHGQIRFPRSSASHNLGQIQGIGERCRLVPAIRGNGPLTVSCPLPAAAFGKPNWDFRFAKRRARTG